MNYLQPGRHDPTRDFVEGAQVTGARLRFYAASYKTGGTLQAFRVAAWVDREAG